jgi:S1-C subfamily serine protease
LKSTRESFLAFQKGSRAVARYKEPVLTRGAKGVAIFRSVSPAVALVVVGDEHNIEGAGAGAIIDSSGYVLTNWHVIEGHTDAVVFLKPPLSSEVSEAYSYLADVVYADPVPDLALLKLLQVRAPLPTIPIADFSQVIVAEDIHIIGHPHLNLWSYSTGVLSQIRKDYDWEYSEGRSHHADVLQMQTAINPGNSGGPVLDDGGRLIGLVAGTEEGQNLDYAVAVDSIRAFLAVAMPQSSANRTGEKPKSGMRPAGTLTRGGGSKAAAAGDEGEAFAATLKTGQVIRKIVYPEFSALWLTDSSDKPSSFLLTDEQGNRIEASGLNGSGGFANWTARLGGGAVVLASGESKVPEVFWAGQSAPPTPPSK